MKKKNINNKDSHLMESYRTLKTRIQLGHPDCKVISIISSQQGDGKTDCSYKLAMSFVNSGKKVLLVDGNLRHPDLSKKVAADKTDGLHKILEGSISMEDSLVMDMDNLYILPTGKTENYSTELLDRENTTNVIKELEKDFDYIIVDTLSLEEGMDALILGKISDGVVYIAVENKTKKDMVEKFHDMIDEANIKLLGLIYKESN